MKNLLLAFLTLFLCVACNQKTDTSVQSEIIEPVEPMEGVWEQTKTYTVWKGDTLNFQDSISSHKIYLDGYIMWNSDPAPDSTEWHAFGTYRYDNGVLTEKLTSMSMPMKSAMGTDDEAILKIDLDEDTFKQTIEGIYNDTTYYMIEHFKRLK